MIQQGNERPWAARETYCACNWLQFVRLFALLGASTTIVPLCLFCLFCLFRVCCCAIWFLTLVFCARQVPGADADMSVAAPGVSGDVDVAGSMPSVEGSASLPEAEGLDDVAPLWNVSQILESCEPAGYGTYRCTT